MNFIKVHVVKEYNRMKLDGDDREKVFDFDPSRPTLVPVCSIKQVQALGGGRTAILTMLVDYHVVEDVDAIDLMLIKNTLRSKT